MSTLLDIKAGGLCGFDWCGRIVIPGARPPIAEPTVLARKSNASVVAAFGALTDIGMVKLCQLVYQEARNPSTNLVWLMLGVVAGRIGALGIADDMLREAAKYANTVAYLQECAFGPAIWLAYRCGLVFSHPTTQIGYLQCVDGETGEYDALASVGMECDLAELNPSVPRAQFEQLSKCSINAELAEASGILREDTLRHDFFKLSGFDPNVRFA